MFPAFELSYYIKGERPVQSFSNEFYIFVFIVSLIIIFSKYRELKFETFEIKRTSNEFMKSVYAASRKLGWGIIVCKENYIEAECYNVWRSRGWQKICIIRNDDGIAINSMIEPTFLAVPDFFGANKLNKKTFIEIYSRSNLVEDIFEVVSNEIKQEEQRIENEPEWNLKNSAKRIVAYVICLVLLALGAVSIFENEILLGLIPSAIAIAYLALDFYILFKKRRNKASS